MRVWLGIAVAVAALLIVAGVTGMPAGAHHASAPFYDKTKSVEIDGAVTRFLFRGRVLRHRKLPELRAGARRQRRR